MLPAVVVEPLDIDDVISILAVSRETGVPVTSRGGGTSIAGNAIGTGIVIDVARHLNRVLEFDSGSRTALVEPGVLLSRLQEWAAPSGLRFGPDPSSQDRATIGGMIGNNACGPHAVAYGRTADNVTDLTAVDGTGRVLRTAAGLQQVPGLTELVTANLDVIRTEFGTFGRQISGYCLEHLLPERGRSLTGALVGSEGTLAVTLDATVSLVPIRPARTLIVLGYPDMPSAADDVPGLLTHHPLAVEGLDARLVDAVRSAGRSAVPPLPAGAGWLMVEVGGETLAEAADIAQAVVRDSSAVDSLVFPAGPAATALWRIRADGAGLAGRSPAGRPAWPGWEDAAVPPDRLGAYLRDFDDLLADYQLTSIPYGHFGDGCVHARIDVPLEHDGSVLRQFVMDAARLVISHGGSCSGEHGDGRARGEVLALQYSQRAIAAFGALKNLLDPRNLLNPGVIVDPRPLDADLRRPQAAPVPAAGGFGFASDDGDFTAAVHRCVGIGRCRADTRASGGFMCPSYLATGQERDVTRGRARVLQELTIGARPPDWGSPQVSESLDLCLSCKACASDCPTGVDMARYKSEVLFRRYRRRPRPMSHYSLGWLPRWLGVLNKLPPRVAAVVASAVNRSFSIPVLRRVVLRAGGLGDRWIPALAPVHVTRRPVPGSHDVPPPADQAVEGAASAGSAPAVVLWVDSFTDAFDPDIARSAAAVLTAAGYRVVVPDRRACCGLSWISTGQLDGAKRRLRRLLDVLEPYAAQGMPIVGLEPSCTAVLRGDLTDLIADDPRADAVAGAVLTLAELLQQAAVGAGWQPPDLSGQHFVVQPHCHQHSVMGFQADEELLTSCGGTVIAVAGCCGMAGNWGMERGHHDLSVAIAGSALLPAVRSREPGTAVLADGFSCRTQITDLTGVRALHLAQLLAAGLSAGGPDDAHPGSISG